MRADKNFYATLLILGLLFSVSVVVRIPLLNRPLSNHHEWLTAHTLRINQIWFENGIRYYGFWPIMTYNNDADRNINNAASIKDDKGNYYYISYPPFSYFLPFMFFRAFSIYPDVLPLQTLNLILHLINSSLIFLLAAKLTEKRSKDEINSAAIIGFAVYVFSPATLWFHSNVYFADTLVQTFFISGIYFAVKYAEERNNRNLLLFSAAVFLMAYTEWIAGFFVASLLLYSLLNRGEKWVKILFLAAAASSLLAVLLTVSHYSQIAGFDSYAAAFTKKYLSRSAVTADEYGQTTNLSSLPKIIKYYMQNYGPIILTLVILLLISVKTNKRRFEEILWDNKTVVFALFLSASPALMHHIFGLNFTLSHDFSVLKTSVFFSLTAALLYESAREKTKKPVDVLLILAFAACVFLYLYGNLFVYTNPFLGGGLRQNLEYREIGLAIKESAKQDEVIFIKKDNYTIVPQLIFYAHRNIALWENEEKARELIRLNKAKKGIVFVLNKDATKIEERYYVDA